MSKNLVNKLNLDDSKYSELLDEELENMMEKESKQETKDKIIAKRKKLSKYNY